jgi:hypothetical protein
MADSESALCNRLSELWNAVSGLGPAFPIEQSELFLFLDTDPDHCGALSLRLGNPIGIEASDLSHLLSPPLNIRPGVSTFFVIDLRKCPKLCLLSANELAICSSNAARSLFVSAYFTHRSAYMEWMRGGIVDLTVELSLANPGILRICVNIPQEVAPDTVVVIDGVYLNGAEVSAAQLFPWSIPVSRLAETKEIPSVTNNYWQTVAFSARNDCVYIPQYNSHLINVASWDGEVIAGLPVSDAGLSQRTCYAGYDEDSGLLVLAGRSDGESHVAAIDPASGHCVWRSAPMLNFAGVAVLSGRGLVAVSQINEGVVRFFRMADGSCVSTVHIKGPSFLAYFEVTSTLYVSSKPMSEDNSGSTCVVTAVNCGDTGFGAAEVLSSVEVGRFSRPLAVIRASGYLASRDDSGVTGRLGDSDLTSTEAFLVIGTFFTPDISIVALPSNRIVALHKQPWPDRKIVGLSSDASGTALAVSDHASKSLYLEPWPQLLSSITDGCARD